MSGTTQIYVALLDEGVDVWRPIEAQHLSGNTYLIVEQHYDRELESWQFEPGDTVVCEVVEASDGKILAAVERGPLPPNGY